MAKVSRPRSGSYMRVNPYNCGTTSVRPANGTTLPYLSKAGAEDGEAADETEEVEGPASLSRIKRGFS